MTQINRSGFTLVELSIVIVIIGFLVAGIAAGSNMVKQAQLRSVITDIQSYQTAYNNFVGQYNLPPGDLNVAASYWSGADNCSASGTATGDNACNGNGDSRIDILAGNTFDESLAAWRHMQLAGLISAGSSPVTDTTTVPIVIGVHVPASKLNGVGFAIGSPYNGINRIPNPVGFDVGIQDINYLYLGQYRTTGVENISGGAFNPEDAFGIDSKIDDGVINAGAFTGAVTGKFRAQLGVSDSGACVSSDNYVISQKNPLCFVGYALN